METKLRKFRNDLNIYKNPERTWQGIKQVATNNQNRGTYRPSIANLFIQLASTNLSSGAVTDCKIKQAEKCEL